MSDSRIDYRAVHVRRAWCGIAMLAAVLSPLRAHDAFAEYIWHRAELAVKEGHMDVTVQLTFFEDWSERERRRMDTDGDGRIQTAEREAYAKMLVDALKTRVGLVVAGHRANLIPLYDPEVDLLASGRVGRAHHQLTLRFFAAIPTELASGAEIVIEDSLWPEARCFGELAVAASAGGFLEVVKVTERDRRAGARSAPLQFTARLAKRNVPPRLNR